MRTIWIIIVLAMACAANAGPWLRPLGEGFMSVDSIGSIGRNQGDLRAYSGVLVEYGARERLTLGFTGGIDLQNNGTVVVFARRAGPEIRPHWVSSFDVGIGVQFDPQNSDPLIKLGAAIGRGALFSDGTGWAHLDGYITLHRQMAPALKIEATLGKRGEQDWLYLFQVFAERLEGNEWEYQIAPSVALPIAKNRHIQLGAFAKTPGDHRFGLKVAIWRSF